MAGDDSLVTRSPAPNPAMSSADVPARGRVGVQRPLALRQAAKSLRLCSSVGG